MSQGPTLTQLAVNLEAGKTTSRALVDKCLACIADPNGEGARAFRAVAIERAIAAADGIDRLRRNGYAPSRYAGIPISIKDLFDVAGEVTAAGSRALADNVEASADAAAVSSLRRAGFILIGRTNMTEFAYSGVGLNPHYGTPLSQWDRRSARIPGGSSSGAAVSVADGMAHAALGTDTGGSLRIPAAYNGLVGFKPTAHRVSASGSVPLSPTLDSVGPIARSAECCEILDRLLSGRAAPADSVRERPLAGLRLVVPRAVLLDDLDEDVARSFADTVSALSQAGALIFEATFAALGDIASINAKGGFAAAESYVWHRQLLETKRDKYDPRVLSRIMRGKEQTAEDYTELVRRRGELINRVREDLAEYDALVCPTVPIVPPRIHELAEANEFNRLNLLILRNPSVVNMFDGCAVSVPIHVSGEAPVGLMLAASADRDMELLSIAASIENAIRSWRARSS